MSSTDELRGAARAVFDETLAAIDAGQAVHRAVRLAGSRLTIVDADFNLDARKVYAVGCGKAAAAMAAALGESLGSRLTAGIISAPHGGRQLDARWRVYAGGHPAPNAESRAAARAAFELLAEADRSEALVIFLISGGGSAMLEWPRDPRLTLDDLRETNRVLVSCGASIAEINCVRRALSAVKGGRLSRLAPRASQATLIISDTSPGRPFDVASGPSIPAPIETDTPAQIVARYELASRLPARVVRALEEACEDEEDVEWMQADASRRHYVLLDNARALEIAASASQARGFMVETAHDIDEQDVAEGARTLVARLFELYGRAGSSSSGVCLVSGGEFSCPVRGEGTGGRNAETALRIAFEFAEQLRRVEGERVPESVVALCAGTDGRDGNSPAAGALCDLTTLARARALRLDPHRHLERSDAYTLFDALGDAVMTGATGTNVRDLR
ncbi:MAG TPA: DUF4147 domain-containing protein, partial [Pyrinomonadaceae bacterium]|nr:DUF4147 domain-containing protein [Pyrinomonadaceae bacterium]